MGEHKDPPPDLAHLLKEFGAELAVGFIHTAAELFEMAHASEWPALELYMNEYLTAAQGWARAAEFGAAPVEEGALATIADWAGPLGVIVETATVLYAVHEVFSEGEHTKHEMGVAYGLMWAATHKVDVPYEPGQWPTSPDTAKELREAFQTGVNEAREKFNHDKRLHDGILKAIHDAKMTQSSHLTCPEERVLNQIWEKIHEDNSDLNGTALYWTDHSGDLGVGQVYHPRVDDTNTGPPLNCADGHGYFGHSPHAGPPPAGFGDRPEDKPSRDPAPGFGHSPHAVEPPPGFGK
jgi:hypothetical protein